MTLQNDNATSHTAHSVHDFRQDRNVSVLPWPAKSPELNPIEHTWDLLDWRVRAMAIPLPRNVREFAGALVEEWDNISQQELENLVQSMRRCTAVLNAAGGHQIDLFLTPLCSGTHYSISVCHMSVELVQFMSQLLNLMFIQIFTS
uniref:Tc1-like transposase DDE domain-containing protein n=1 Tax=Oncorhynchus tshawytscha TaxID=74940 RepID=A0AAZ3NV80_ONCTS